MAAELGELAVVMHWDWKSGGERGAREVISISLEEARSYGGERESGHEVISISLGKAKGRS